MAFVPDEQARPAASAALLTLLTLALAGHQGPGRMLPPSPLMPSPGGRQPMPVPQPAPNWQPMAVPQASLPPREAPPMFYGAQLPRHAPTVPYRFFT